MPINVYIVYVFKSTYMMRYEFVVATVAASGTARH